MKIVAPKNRHLDPSCLRHVHGRQTGSPGTLLRMKERILKLSDGTEVFLVLVVAFGVFVPGNLLALI